VLATCSIGRTGIAAVGADAGCLADAALQQMGQQLGFKSPSRTQRSTALQDPPADSSPASTGSSREFGAAVRVALPGDMASVSDTGGGAARASSLMTCTYCEVFYTCCAYHSCR
jgi:hypothetical protein